MFFVLFWLLRLIGVLLAGFCAMKLCRTSTDAIWFGCALAAWSLVELGTVYGRQVEAHLGHKEIVPLPAPPKNDEAIPTIAPASPVKLAKVSVPGVNAPIKQLAAAAVDFAKDKKSRGDRRALYEIIEKSLESSITRSSPWFQPAVQEAKRIALLNETTKSARS